jgi:pimeloyl-ACP methyl ester carboxylesterase
LEELRLIAGMKHLVLIPAMGCDDRLYTQLAQSLSSQINVHVVVADEADLKTCVAQVLALAPQKFIVLGTSFGGRTALELVPTAPHRVEGLVVIGAGAGPAADPAAGRQRSVRLRGGEFEHVVAEMADMVSHLPGPNGPGSRNLFIEMVRGQGAEFMARQSDALAGRLDLWGRLGEITCPSLMLWGEHDKFSPAREGLRMSTLIPHARYVEIADCGHFPSLEAPEETAAILLHWLQDAKLISS